MNEKPLKLLIVEDDPSDCKAFTEALKNRDDINLIAITDSDIEAIKYVKFKQPDAIILDIELNNSTSGNPDSFEFLQIVQSLQLDIKPIIIVTTHLNSPAIYNFLHKSGVDMVLYKDHPKYCANFVLNKFNILKPQVVESKITVLKEEIVQTEQILSEHIYRELDLLGITPNLKGREYIHDAIFYLIQNAKNSNTQGVMPYLAKLHCKSANTINNGIQNAIIHAWRVCAIEDLEIHYTAKVNVETGLPTSMQFIYYYVDKIKKML